MKSRRAFTLIEVIVSLAIFAFAAVVLGAAYLNVLNDYAAVDRGTDEDPDVAFAREELLTQGDLATAQTGDQYDTADGRTVKWTADIAPTNTTDLFDVTFSCTISSTGGTAQPKTVNQEFMLLRPTWSQPADEASLRQQAAARIAQLQGKQP